MSWRDNLRNASFRGVSFKVFSTSLGIGRRNILHQYPFRETPFLEDIGRGADTFTINGYIIQTSDNDFDYFAERDALIAALKAEGVGTLIHPFLGEKTVGTQGSARIEENFRDGGMASFSMTFVEAGISLEPTGATDFAGTVGAGADTLINSLADSVTNKFDTGGSDFLADSALTNVQGGLTMIQKTLNTLQGGTPGTISEALFKLATIQTDVPGVIDSPSQLAGLLTSAMSIYSDILSDPVSPTAGSAGSVRPNITAPLVLLDFGKPLDTDSPNIFGGALPVIDETTVTRETEATNKEIIVDFFRGGGLAEAARASATIDYESQQEAEAVLTLLTDAHTALLASIGEDLADDETFDSIRDLQPLVVEAMRGKGANLPEIRDFNLPADVLPSLVISHLLYKDIDREASIVDRNQPALIHPGFPPAGGSIEVLSE